jgi:hypothetical protein
MSIWSSSCGEGESDSHLRVFRLSRVSLYVGLTLIVIGVSLVSNAFFAWSVLPHVTETIFAEQGASSRQYYCYLKAGDRMIISSAITGPALLNVSVVRLATNQIEMESGGEDAMMVTFVPASRGTFLVNVSVVAGEQGASVRQDITVRGDTPTDMIEPAEYAILGGLTFTALSLAIDVFGRPMDRKALSSQATLNQQPRRLRYPIFFSLVSWEVFGSRKIYFSFLVLLATLYSAAGFQAAFTSRTPNLTFNLAGMYAPSFLPNKDWTNLFPLIVAIAAFAFSYERDRLVLRSTLLNPIRPITVFLAKVTSLLLVVCVPVAMAIALTIALFDPRLFLANPLLVWNNLWIWVTIYVLFACVMVGFALLAAVFFKRAIYAFIVPVFVYFLVDTEGFGVTKLLPTYVWATSGVGALRSVLRLPYYDWGAFLSDAQPSLLLALMLGILALVVFEIQEKE